MTLRTVALALVALALAAAPAAAAEAAPPLASYWSGFVDHWSGAFKKQNGIVMFALLVGAVCLFVITRGKWQK
jgi:hypothetical protein